MKKIISVVTLVALAMATVLAACGGKENSSSSPATQTQVSTSEQSSTPSKTEPDVIKIAYIQHPADTIKEGTPALKYLEEKTNTKIQLTVLPWDGGKEKRNLLLSSGDIPDMVSILGETGLANLYGSQGVFEPVDQLIEQYGSNMKELLDKKLTVSVRNDKGEMYYIPSILEDQMLSASGISYREDLMTELGLKEPNTLDEWYNALKAAKQKYPDKIPFEMKDGFGAIFSAFNDAFDIRYLGNYVEFQDGKIQSYADSDKLKQLLQFAHKLYSEDLMEKEYMTKSYEQWWGDVTSGKVFSFWSNYHRTAMANVEGKKAGIDLNFAGADQMIGISGKRDFYISASPIYPMGFAISAKSNVKPAVMRLLNWVYSKEGMDWWFYGLEGVTYKRVDGKIEIIGKPEDWYNNLADIGAEPSEWARKIPKTYFTDGPEGPSWSKLASEAIMKKNQHVQLLPTIIVPDNLQKELSSISATIDPYYDKWMNEFVIGAKSFDQWPEYVKGMKDLKLDRIVEIYQASYDAMQMKAE